MQFMEQSRHSPSPAMASAWSATAIGKIVFSLILVVCVLIGITRRGTDSLSVPSMKWVGAGPTEVVLLGSPANSTRSSVSVAPVQTANRPLAGSSRASGNQGHRLADSRTTPEGNGSAQPAAAKTESEKRIFAGRVVDNNGAPVANAGIRYVISFYPLEGNTGSRYSSYYGPFFFTRTGVDGTFRFELSPSKLDRMSFDSKDMLSRLNIAVTHPDHAIWWQEFPFQSTTDMEIQLETPEIISGKVMNEAGEPIQNAKIQIQSVFRGDPIPTDPGNRLTHNALPQPVKTDANGEFILPGLPQGATISLDVQGPGYAKESRHSVPVGTKMLEFQLKGEGRIEGRITYAGTGKSVRGAMVSFQGIYPTRGWREARTNWRGNYRLKNVASGTYNLGLNHGPEGWTAIAKEPITVSEGETVNVDLTLIRSGIISGQVTDQDTNEPIANHPIRLSDAARPEGSSLMSHLAITDQTGAYRFDAVPGRALVHTNPPGGYQGVGQIERPNIGQIQRRVDVVEGETVVVDFQFSRGLKLVGRVLTENGEPVVGARISNTRYRREVYSISDASGRFTVTGLRSGQRLDFKAEHSGLGLRGMAEIEVEPDVPIEIRMKPYGRVKVSGRVVDRAGNPMPSMDVQLITWDLQRYMGKVTNVAVTDDDGRFREIELIVGDEYEIYVELEGYRRAETKRFVATAESTQISDLVLLPAGGEFFIEGRVTDTSGDPVRGVRLSIGQQSQHWLTHTDENGDYRLDDLSMAVVYSLSIFDDPRYADHRFEILKTNQRHDLVLVKTDGYLAGKVVDAHGQPIEQVGVRVRGEANPFSGYQYPHTQTNLHGEFELKHIKDPVVSVRVINRKYRKTFENVAVNQRDLVLTLTSVDVRPEPTPEQQAKRSYSEACRERFKTLVSRTASQLTVTEWLSGSPISIEDLKGKTVALHFWSLNHTDHVRQIRLLNILQEIFRDQGLICVAICPATAAVETVRQHIAEESLSYSVGLDSPTEVVSAEGETFDRYAIGWGSQIVLINAAGEITGSAWEHEYEDKIQALLAD